MSGKRKDNISIEQICCIKAFKNLEKDTQQKILSICESHVYKKGQILFLEKDQVNVFYAILSGKVAMSRYSGWGQKRIFFILGVGELINEVVFDDLPVSVVCEVFENATILKFRKKDFLNIMKEDFTLTLNIMNSIGRKQRRLYRQLKNTVPIKMDKKLAAKLWKLSRDYGIQRDEWIQINLKITVTHLSYMLGSSRETISRAMTILIEAGIIKWQGKQLLVREEKLLQYYRNP
ncbi:Crp/Fnr family transcriptional regulator [Anaeromonas gelatinilytica]|uniref:Crp/Fnr family transcriptional regulator n=1 Tax=Anaeromonas gelatinilytica TaxID=2683194 RepID=UPI002079033E|nr:Crp/Fnr family transcriptional regulator [Anaeromonas gelatinilytica]